jgi:hypothetical protein
MLGPGDSPLESVIRLSSQISGTSQPTGRGDVSLEELADLHQMGLPPRHGISHVNFIASSESLVTKERTSGHKFGASSSHLV